MMNALALFILGVVIVIVQTTLFRLFDVPYLKAPLVLAVVIYAAFYVETVRGLILAFMLGYAMDVFSGGPKGITPSIMVVLCLIGQWMSGGIFVKGKLALGLVAFGFGAIHGILWKLVEAFVQGRTWPEGFPLPLILLQAVVFAAASPIIVWLASLLDRWCTAGWRHLQGQRP